MSARRNFKLCSMLLVWFLYCIRMSKLTVLGPAGNLFTPWFKLIARDYLYGWWDQLLARKNSQGLVEAKSLKDLTDDRVIKMV
jgi:isopentenyl-diphosphate delta-isomerase